MINEFVVDENNVGKRLDIFLLEKYPDCSRSHIKNLIEKNKVYINDKSD